MAQSGRYELIYFNIRGYGEISRLIFKLVGVDFVDSRFPTTPEQVHPEWDIVKDSGKFPFNRVPILVIDGKHILAQSAAIERYLSKQFGLFGKDDIEAAHIDSVCEQLNDVMLAFWAQLEAPTEEAADQLRNTFYQKQLPEFVRLFERWLSKTSSGHFVGDKFTLADVKFLHIFSELDDQSLVSSALKSAPLLSALRNRLATHPNIAKWIKERPKTNI